MRTNRFEIQVWHRGYDLRIDVGRIYCVLQGRDVVEQFYDYLTGPSGGRLHLGRVILVVEHSDENEIYIDARCVESSSGIWLSEAERQTAIEAVEALLKRETGGML